MKRKFNFLKPIFPYLSIIILSISVLLPLFNFGFFTMHDDQQIARLYEMHQGLSGGQFPVRWGSHLGFGFGYPIFNFYPPLIYYFAEVFHLLGFSLIDSTKLMLGLGFLLSGVFMYLWASKYTGKVGGVVSSLLYIYAPYHIVTIYVRGAMAEFFAFVWIPAVFWALDNLFEKKTTLWAVISGIFLACVILTHNLIALPFAPFVLIYCLYNLLYSKKDRKQLFSSLVLTGSIGLCLSAFFWLPALLEKKYTLVDAILTKELASYTLHFLSPTQLWQSAWGYGGSIPGIYDGMSLKAGKIHLLGSLFALCLFVWYLLKRKTKKEGHVITVISAFLFFSLFMTTYFSSFLWDNVQPLSYLQFPWRFLLFTSVFSSFLTGILVSLIIKNISQRLGMVMSVVLVFLAVVTMVPYARPQKYLSVTDDFYIKNKDIEWRISKTSFEFVPKDVKTKISALGTTIVDIEKNELPERTYVILGGDTKIVEKHITPSLKQFSVSGEKSTVQLATYSFPGWKVYIDGKEIVYKDNNKFKLITFDIPGGDHTIEAKLINTLVRIVGNTLSLLVLLSLPIIIIRRKIL